MNRIPNDLVTRSAAAITAAGEDWKRIWDESSEVVVFGSTAAGLNGPHSDIDILASGPSRPRKTRALDLITYSPETLLTPPWVESELAGHIAAFGVWIKGSPQWTAGVKISEITLDRKLARIQRLLAATRDHWSRLDPDFRRRSLNSIRREIQRAALLEKGMAIPPTPELDRRAAQQPATELSGWISELQNVRTPDDGASLLSRLSRQFPGPSRAYLAGSRGSGQHISLISH